MKSWILVPGISNCSCVVMGTALVYIADQFLRNTMTKGDLNFSIALKYFH